MINLSGAPERVVLQPSSHFLLNQKEFETIKLIGEGGFANIYHVKNEEQEYALKVTKLWEFMPNERIEYATRFKQEYEIASKLDPNYIVQSQEFGLLMGNPSMTMEYCPNGSLRSIMNKSNDYDLVAIFSQILESLGHLHQEGVIHRDIKPENILFDASYRPKLSDFGISASIRKRLTKPNILGHVKQVFATIVYSPPEQMDAKRAYKQMGPSNDIYAFGATLYEFLAGEGNFPFGSYEDFEEDNKAYLKRIKNEDWDRSKLYSCDNADLWIAVIDGCLKYKPSDRFGDTYEILQLLPIQTKNFQNPIYINDKNEWVLEVKNGDEIGRHYYINRMIEHKHVEELTVGWFNESEPFSNDVGITENFTNYISSKHATLRYENHTNSWFILDGQFLDYNKTSLKPSTNGLFINGIQIGSTWYKLSLNDIITLGDTTIKVSVQ